MSACPTCRSIVAAVSYAGGEFGNARRKFQRAQTARNHAAVIESRDRFREQKARLADHKATDHSEEDQ